MITTSKQITLAAAGGLVSLVLLATQAFAYSEAVINACTDDYLAYCSAYDENSAQGERCMRAGAANSRRAVSTHLLPPARSPRPQLRAVPSAKTAKRACGHEARAMRPGFRTGAERCRGDT